MNDIANSAANNLKNDTGINAIGFIEAALKATRGMTGPQAGVTIAALGTLGIGTCYVIHEIGALVKGGYVESVDLERRKINFNRPSQTVGA